MNAPRRTPRRSIDGVVMLDKPLGLTSNAALQKVRHLYRADKAGHTGTLDPLATGLLPLCLGEATKFAGTLLDADKTYEAGVRLGITTTTADAEGAVREVRPVQVDTVQLEAALQRFRGDIAQVPPMYSALKRDGRPLYEYARQGQEVERAARAVTIHELQLMQFAGERMSIRVRCSKGTYIRTLAEDIGAVLGCGAHLESLRRTAIGPYTLSQAHSLAALEAMPEDARDALLAPVDALLAELPVVQLSPVEAERLLQGQALSWQGAAVTGLCRAYWQERFLGLCEIFAEGRLVSRRLLAGKA